MVEPLSVNTDGVRSLAEIHTAVAAGLGSVNNGAPGSAAVATSHGTIAAAVEAALSGALGSRTGSVTATQNSGARISELLAQAAMAYERGDQRGAEAIKAAADAIARGEAPAGGGAPGAPAGSGGGVPGGGADAMGQMMGQLGQLGQLGQMGQQLGAPLAALAQPLQQLPQQVAQAVQQAAQSAAQPTDSDTPPAEPGKPAPEPETPIAMPETPEAEYAEVVPDGAASGTQPGAGPAPVAPAERAAAATRPSAD